MNFHYIYMQLLDNTFNYLLLVKKKMAKIICCPPNGQDKKKWAAAGKMVSPTMITLKNWLDQPLSGFWIGGLIDLLRPKHRPVLGHIQCMD